MADSNTCGPSDSDGAGAAQGFGVNCCRAISPIYDTQVSINPNGNTGSSDTVALIARGNIASGEFYGAEISFEDGKLIVFRNDDYGGKWQWI